MLGVEPGSVVLWWEDDALRCGVVLAEEKQRLAILEQGGRESRLPRPRVVAVLERGEAPGRDPDSRGRALRRALQADERLQARAREVDVPTLWDLVVQGGDRLLTEAELASIAFDRPGETERAAVLLALRRDGIRFVRKTAGWMARSVDHVAEIQSGRAAETRRLEERGEVVSALAAALRGTPFVPTGSETERIVIEALSSLAVFDQDAPEKERALALATLEAVHAPGDRPAERAFRLLRLLGRFESDDANLSIERYGLRAEFPPAVEEAAARAAGRGFDRSGRTDLSGQNALTIDAPWTTEVDDAVTIAATSRGGWEVGVHIADPAAFFGPSDPVDAEALLRGTTYYFPERKLLMLPGVLSEGAASLAEGTIRPALSFLVTLDAEGSVLHQEILRSIVRVAARFDYDEVDRILASRDGPHAEALRSFDLCAAARERRRLRAGAVALRAQEAEVRVAADGKLQLTRRDQGARSQRLVSELMVLAGEVAASWLVSRGAPAIFRRQAPPDGGVPEVDPALPEAVRVRAVRKVLKRGEAVLSPGPHHGLGLQAYAQVTSPLRRYQDLTLHRQIASILTTGAPAYGPPEMQSILASTERAESDGRRAERAAQRYAMLRWLSGLTGGTVTGVVVEVAPRVVVTLDETLVDEPVAAFARAALGDRVRLRIERVNPRADLLVLRPA